MNVCWSQVNIRSTMAGGKLLKKKILSECTSVHKHVLIYLCPLKNTVCFCFIILGFFAEFLPGFANFFACFQGFKIIFISFATPISEKLAFVSSLVMVESFKVSIARSLISIHGTNFGVILKINVKFESYNLQIKGLNFSAKSIPENLLS